MTALPGQTCSVNTTLPCPVHHASLRSQHTTNPLCINLPMLQVLYLLGMGEFLPNRLTAPLLSTLCTGWPLDEVCAAAISFFFFGPSQHIRPQDYTGELCN